MEKNERLGSKVAKRTRFDSTNETTIFIFVFRYDSKRIYRSQLRYIVLESIYESIRACTSLTKIIDFDFRDFLPNGIQDFDIWVFGIQDIDIRDIDFGFLDVYQELCSVFPKWPNSKKLILRKMRKIYTTIPEWPNCIWWMNFNKISIMPI